MLIFDILILKDCENLTLLRFQLMYSEGMKSFNCMLLKLGTCLEGCVSKEVIIMVKEQKIE